MENIFSERIEGLRNLMRENGWDAVILTGGDPHGSEYPAARWKQVEWLTGFTGESADVVVTLDHAGLWTDTRYFIQAENQLRGTGVALHKTRIPEQVLIPEWLAVHFADEDVVIAVDGECTVAGFVADTDRFLKANRVGSCFISVPGLLDGLWTDRPRIPQTPVFTIDPGESREEKMAFLREFCRKKGYDGMLLSALDDIAWTLNARAADIEYTPVIISYLLVTEDDTVWFVLKDRVEDPESEAAFDEMASVRLERYDSIKDVIADECTGMKIAVDRDTINFDLLDSLERSRVDVIACQSPVGLRKAVKNGKEIEDLRRAMLQDGIAMEKFLFWLEKSLSADKRITEWDAAVKLGQYRAECSGYRGDSFETISAYGPGAALPHYVTPHVDSPVIEPHGLYLCDSGAQYYDEGQRCGGTTDLTRTIPLGECTELEKEDYTLVLKGHIDLAMAVFPEGTPGCRIDALAREPLWRYHRNFGHGTGHGVGYFLGCHEGPQDIRQNLNPTALMPGMVCSDEPGIYREGMHGVRHENLLLCIGDEPDEFGKWMRFETLTLCHFDTSAVIREILDDGERQWLNSYNARVREALRPHLPQDVAEWLEKKTKEI